jgi:hypothetical protein
MKPLFLASILISYLVFNQSALPQSSSLFESAVRPDRLQDCSMNMDCYIEAARTCKPAQVGPPGLMVINEC